VGIRGGRDGHTGSAAPTTEAAPTGKEHLRRQSRSGGSSTNTAARNGREWECGGGRFWKRTAGEADAAATDGSQARRQERLH